MMMPSLNLFSPPKVTIKRRRYVLDDDDDDHDDNTAFAPARDTSIEIYTDCPQVVRPTKRHRRCITPVPSFTNLSLFLPILEDPGQETSATTMCAHPEGESPPPSLSFAYRQEEDKRREGAGRRSVSPSNYHFDETTPFLQPKKKKSLNIDQEEEDQPYDIEQEEQQDSRCCYLNPVVYNNSNNNSNPSPPPRMMINKSTRSNSSSSSRKYLPSYPHYGSQADTVQRQRQRHTPRRVLPTPSPFLPFASSPVTTHNIDDTIAIVEQFQRAIRLSSEGQDQEELVPPPPTTRFATKFSNDSSSSSGRSRNTHTV